MTRFTLAFVFAISVCGATLHAERPNIVFILADDLAWADLGCYGHPWHQTPHLDRLAAQGVRLTNGYAPAPICSASRASILTGKTTARLGFEFVTKNEPGYQKLDAPTPLRAPPLTLNLPLAETTLGEVLSGVGYETTFFGKWHLNAHYGRYLGWSPTHGPVQQGFQIAVEDFGAHPYSWKRGKTPKQITKRGVYPKDSMVRRVTDYIAQPHDQPFFVMASQFYVHTPVKTPCRWLVEKYDRRIPQDAPARERRLRYAAFVETLDHYVGKILTAVDEAEIAEETLVVFLSDNGGHPEYTANGPLRGSKWNLYEGGIRVPFLIRWPERIAAGTTSDRPAIGYDLLPTFAEVAGADLPEQVDGVSLLDMLSGESERTRAMVWHFPYYHPERGFRDAPETIGVNDFVTSRTRPQSAIRRGRYKLIRLYEQEPPELFDLETDLSEQTDLARAKPELASELNSLLSEKLSAMDARLPEPTASLPLP
jgi:uncharacterized sulfatase